MGDLREFEGLHRELTERVIKVFYAVYNELGYGFLEAVYKEAMLVALRDSGLQVEAEFAIPVSFRGEVIGIFRADLLVEGKIIVELKTAERIGNAHEAQLLNYLRATPIEVGLVLNFGESPAIRRVNMTNDRKKLAQPSMA